MTSANEITEADANAIYDVLVQECGWRESTREDFVGSVVRSGCWDDDESAWAISLLPCEWLVSFNGEFQAVANARLEKLRKQVSEV